MKNKGNTKHNHHRIQNKEQPKIRFNTGNLQHSNNCECENKEKGNPPIWETTEIRKKQVTATELKNIKKESSNPNRTAIDKPEYSTSV